MRLGAIAVRDALGGDVPGITDHDIQEALWHYYYDVEKSVNYLLQSRTPKQELSKKKKAKGGSIFLHLAISNEGMCHKDSVGDEAGMVDDQGLGGASPHTSWESWKDCN